mgnify:CR=1 FL=1
MNEVPKNILKTGTTTIAIKCADGIVVAADKRATAGGMIADRDAKKVYQIVDEIPRPDSPLIQARYLKARSWQDFYCLKYV